MKKANDLIKKDTGIDQQALTNREKTTLLDALKQQYPLSELLERKRSIYRALEREDMR